MTEKKSELEMELEKMVVKTKEGWIIQEKAIAIVKNHLLTEDELKVTIKCYDLDCYTEYKGLKVKLKALTRSEE